MTALQIAYIAGGLIALAPVLLIARYAHTHPNLGAYLEGYSHYLPTVAAPPPTHTCFEARAGLWMQARFGSLLRAPTNDLDLLQIPVHQFYGRKLIMALAGIVFPTVVSVGLSLAGIPVPIGIPVIGTILMAIILSFLPDLDIRHKAQEAREEFGYVLSSYMDLVAMERRSGTSPRQAMEQAARMGDSWVFHRLSEELRGSRLSGISPWDALEQVGTRFIIPELAELARVMRTAGDENAAVFDTLRARARSMRKTHLARELTRANEVSTKRNAPMSLLAVVFLLLLATPAVIRIIFI